MIPVLKVSFIRVGLDVGMKRAASAGAAHADLPFCPQLLNRFAVVAFHWQESSALPQNVGCGFLFPAMLGGRGQGRLGPLSPFPSAALFVHERGRSIGQ